MPSSARGIDPIEAREAAKNEVKPVTVAAGIEQFIEEAKATLPRSWKDYRWALSTYVKPRLGKMALNSVAQANVTALLNSVRDERKAEAENGEAVH